MKLVKATCAAATLTLALLGEVASAAPVLYNIDPGHTYPSFAADHMGGLSVWRGKFTHSTGTVTLDRAAHSGTVDITVEVGSIDFGNEKLDEHAKSPDLFNVGQFPTAHYAGTFSAFSGDAPTEVHGELTLHGVTRPVVLKINSFLCKPNPMTRKETCGADAAAVFNRADFGINFGQQFGFKQEVQLAIQVEAIKAD